MLRLSNFLSSIYIGSRSWCHNSKLSHDLANHDSDPSRDQVKLELHDTLLMSQTHHGNGRDKYESSKMYQS